MKQLVFVFFLVMTSISFAQERNRPQSFSNVARQIAEKKLSVGVFADTGREFGDMSKGDVSLQFALALAGRLSEEGVTLSAMPKTDTQDLIGGWAGRDDWATTRPAVGGSPDLMIGFLINGSSLWANQSSTSGNSNWLSTDSQANSNGQQIFRASGAIVVVDMRVTPHTYAVVDLPLLDSTQQVEQSSSDAQSVRGWWRARDTSSYSSSMSQSSDIQSLVKKVSTGQARLGLQRLLALPFLRTVIDAPIKLGFKHPMAEGMKGDKVSYEVTGSEVACLKGKKVHLVLLELCSRRERGLTGTITEIFGSRAVVTLDDQYQTTDFDLDPNQVDITN